MHVEYVLHPIGHQAAVRHVVLGRMSYEMGYVSYVYGSNGIKRSKRPFRGFATTAKASAEFRPASMGVVPPRLGEAAGKKIARSD